jgi:ribosome-binding protein aMBF1 (putative translation factor)
MSKPGGTIYAIGAAGTSLVKIGCTTKNVQQRLASLQTGHPYTLQVLAALPVETNPHRIEKLIHQFLETERQHGEWFALEIDQPRLEALILRAVQWLRDEQQRQEEKRLQQEQKPQTVDMAMREILGARICWHRMSLGLNQTELAERTSIPYQVISRLEHGHQSIYVERLAELATTLNVSADYLMGLTDDPTPSRKRPRPRKTAPVG